MTTGYDDNYHGDASDEQLVDDPLTADELDIDPDDADLDLLTAEEDLEALDEDQFDAWPGDVLGDSPEAFERDETVDSLIRRQLDDG